MLARHVILWLLLALLPLRGLAISTMAMPGAAASHVGMDIDVSSTTHDQPPCHGDAADPGTDAGNHTCGLCDLCHNAAAAAAFDASSLVTPESLPPPGAARDTGRHAVGGLDRPPRRFHS